MPRIPRAIIEEMIAHAREDLPNEACGMVHAQAGEPVAVHRVKNVAGDDGHGSPYRYLMDPMQQFRLEQQRDDTGESLFAIYHSHVASEARPSQTDERQAFFPPGEFHRDPAYPETYYILVSLAHEPPDVRAWMIRRPLDAQDTRPEVVEAPIEVI
jgi:[CysO sulfur-carrier protein]-S-L-cysteine hydrolase